MVSKITSPSVSNQMTEADAGCGAASIRHVLVPLDGSPLAESALPWAVAVAEALPARITLLRVLEKPSLASSTSHHHDAVDWEMRRVEAESALTRIDRELKARHLASSIAVLEGRPAEQIVNFARAQGVDLVVLSSHGEGGMSGWALSSTVLMVVARTSNSVLVVPAHTSHGRKIGEVQIRRLLVPLDCSPRAECILPLASAISRAHGAEMILAHIVPEPEMPRRLPPSPEDLSAAAILTDRNRAAAERYLAELRDQLVEQQLRVGVRIVVSSQRARAVRAIADDAGVDLVVLSAHGRTGDVSERYGSVAARLLEQSRRPILVIQDLGGGPTPTAQEEAAQSRPGH